MKCLQLIVDFIFLVFYKQRLEFRNSVTSQAVLNFEPIRGSFEIVIHHRIVIHTDRNRINEKQLKYQIIECNRHPYFRS